MRLFFVGSGDRWGTKSPDASATGSDGMMAEIAAHLGAGGHEFVLCSPYEGSLDRVVLEGASRCAAPPTISMHFPNTSGIKAKVDSAEEEFALKLRRFLHAAPIEQDDKSMRYAWLLSQLSALDTADVVIAAGGNPSGSANMLLNLAEARGRPVLPFGHLGGAAALSLTRQRFGLTDRLGGMTDWLGAPDRVEAASEALELLLSDRSLPASAAPPRTFFISYARERAADADFVEMTLRRRQGQVHRDDQDFDPGGELVAEIRQAIIGSDVFVALWSREYACSPWCYDELSLALERHGTCSIMIWIIELDDTRMVHPGARGLIRYKGGNRVELERTLGKLLESRKAQ